MPSIEIRTIHDSDAEELFALAMAQGADLDGFAWRKNLRSVQDELGFIAWAHGAEAKGDAYCRAIILDGQIAGCASLYKPHPGAFNSAPEAPSLQVGYWVGRTFRGQGAGSTAMALLMAEVAALSPEPLTVGIRTRSKNAASLSMAAKLGLTLQGFASPSMFDEQDVDALLSGPLATPRPTPKQKP